MGLVRGKSFDPRKLTLNHQVLAYGYRVEPALLAVRIYDPNWPDRDDVAVRFHLAEGQAPRLESSTGEPLRGIFSAKYRPREPKVWQG